jgi:hypothetical protein
VSQAESLIRATARDRRRRAPGPTGRPIMTDWVTTQARRSSRELLIGLATRHRWSNAQTCFEQHASDLSVERQPVKSGVVDFRHAQQAQEPALEPA